MLYYELRRRVLLKHFSSGFYNSIGTERNNMIALRIYIDVVYSNLTITNKKNRIQIDVVYSSLSRAIKKQTINNIKLYKINISKW